MTPRTEEGPLPGLDALLRRAGKWLLVGYTVAMVLFAFVPGAARNDDSPGPAEAPQQIMIG
jgi:hypothetical protein